LTKGNWICCCKVNCFILETSKISLSTFLATILVKGIIPNVETITGDEEKFLMTGALTPQLY